MRATLTNSTLRKLGVTIAITALIGLGTGTAEAVDISSVTDTYLFHTSLGNFVQIRATRPYAGQLDWSSDGCSDAPDQPFGFDFLPGCYRHDFGYRNYKRQGRFNETTRKAIDDNLYADLKGICGSNSACKATAWVYYEAVRKFGG